MGTIGNYLEKKLLDHVFGNGSYTPPSIYIGLSTTLPSNDGTNVSEPTGNGYSRKNFSTWNIAANRIISNNGIITFATSMGDWGTITHYVIYDAETNGNMLAFGSLSSAKTVTNGNILTIASNDLEISFNTGGFSTFLINELLDHIFGNGSYTPPSIYIGLSTTIPTDTNAGTEVVGNNYARAICLNWNIASGNNAITDNAAEILFSIPSGSWGICVFATIHDAISSGNYLARGDITDQMPASGDTVKFNVGDLNITID
jgi:hypothetical protein